MNGNLGEQVRQLRQHAASAMDANHAEALPRSRALANVQSALLTEGLTQTHAMNMAAMMAVELAMAVTPTPVMVAMYPDFWIAGPGVDVARRVQCGHGYHLTDSCPNCAQEFDEIDNVVRALVPDVEITTSSGDVHSVNLPRGGRIAFGWDETHRGYMFTVFDADDEVVRSDGGSEDDMYKVAAEIAEWVTGTREWIR